MFEKMLFSEATAAVAAERKEATSSVFEWDFFSPKRMMLISWSSSSSSSSLSSLLLLLLLKLQFLNRLFLRVAFRIETELDGGKEEAKEIAFADVIAGIGMGFFPASDASIGESFAEGIEETLVLADELLF